MIIADVKVVWARDDDGHVGGFVVEKDAAFSVRDIEGKFSLAINDDVEGQLQKLPDNRGIICLPIASTESERPCPADWMGVSELRGALSARRLLLRNCAGVKAKARQIYWSLHRQFELAQETLSGWRRKSPRRSYWRFVIRV